jgi:hypothetical protein
VPLDFRPGQNTWLLFDGTAGQRVSVGLSGITFAPGYCCDIGTVALYKPDGTVLQAPVAFTNQGAGTASVALPASGTYAILIDPYLGRSGAITVTLSADLSPQITINGPSVVLDFNAGQNAWLTFAGTAGQRVSVGLSAISIAPTYCCDIGTVSLYKPDGTVLQAPVAFTNQGAGTASVVLPASGNYSILIDPYIGRSGAITATLSADLSPPMTINRFPTWTKCVVAVRRHRWTAREYWFEWDHVRTWLLLRHRKCSALQTGWHSVAVADGVYESRSRYGECGAASFRHLRVSHRSISRAEWRDHRNTIRGPFTADHY